VTALFDLLMSADMKVADPDVMTTALTDRLGVLQHPKWRMAIPTSSYVAWFLRTQQSLAVAPTRLEPQGHVDRPNLGDPAFNEYLDSVVAFQGRHRPVKTHSTIVTTSDFDGLIERLLRRRVPFRIAPTSPELPMPRLWLGSTPEHPAYRPDADGGICLEVLPTRSLQLPPGTEDAPEPDDPSPADLVRVVARSFIVRDLADILARLSRNLGWEPHAVEELRDARCRRARFTFGLRHSATFDLLEPLDAGSEAGRYLATWGPGPYTVRLSTVDLDAKAADLEARGTRYRRVPPGDDLGPALRVHPADLLGLEVEILQHVPG
jgi:hypothetical protein